jgi:DNA-binding beta-propeller fold protein YncE
LKRVALIAIILVLASISFLACGYSNSSYKPPSGLTTRVFASQQISGPTSLGGLVIINGANDTLARASEIGAGSSPGLMAISPEKATLLVFDSATNTVQVVNAKTETPEGSIQLAGPTTSMVIPTGSFGYAAVPTAVFNGDIVPPGAIEVMNLTLGGIAATISVPNAQTVVASPDGTQLLVFSSDSDAVTLVSPSLVNTVNPVTTTVSGFDRPVNAVFGSDGTAYILNCGPQCGSASASASVQVLSFGTTPTAGASVAVDGATIGLVSGSTLYVAGTPTASTGNSSPNNLCTGQTTAAPTCGRLDIVDLGSMAVTGSAVITDGYHDRIDMSSNGQLFIGSHTCSTVGNVNAPQGEVRGCLSIFDTTTATVVIPPDNGDVTGLQSFTSRRVEYVAEGGNLRVYDTTKNKLLLNSIITTGTIGITGQIIDVKAVDFF